MRAYSWCYHVPSFTQTNVLAPRDGIVKEVLFSDGDVVPGDSKLIELEDKPTE